MSEANAEEKAVNGDRSGEPILESRGRSTKIFGILVTRDDIIQALGQLEYSTQRILLALMASHCRRRRRD
jgi:hypothetical protein